MKSDLKSLKRGDIYIGHTFSKDNTKSSYKKWNRTEGGQ